MTIAWTLRLRLGSSRAFFDSCLRFESYAEARTHGENLAKRWRLLQEFRVVRLANDRIAFLW